MTQGVRVLILDDHPLFREGVRSLLVCLDPQVVVTQAASLAELRALQGTVFDLVLTDLQLPGAQGLQTVSTAKALFPEASVVVVSGDDSAATIREAIQLGAAGYVPKTTDPSVTTHALRLVLAQGIYLPPQALQANPSPADPPPADHPVDWVHGLSPRQHAVLKCLLQGKVNKVIAREIGIAEGTVKAHLWAVYQLLGVSNRTQAMYRAHELKLFGVLQGPSTGQTRAS